MLLNDPQSIDQDDLAEAIERDRRVPRIQFSKPEACRPEILAQVNRCCQRFDTRVQVRFWGHYKREFDFGVLGQIPQVRALIIDVDQASGIEGLESLSNLEELGFGVSEGNNSGLLKLKNLRNLRRLTLLPMPRQNVDLAPLAGFARLEELTLCGQARNIDVLPQLGTVRKLGLSGMRNTVRLDTVRSMTGLETLWVVQGGRSNTNEFANERVTSLRVDRIRGMEEIDLSGFSRLELLAIEDQSKIAVLDLRPLINTLRRLQIFNMKNLDQLVGIEEQTRLESLWQGQTKVDPDQLIGRLPKSIRAVGMMGYAKKQGEQLKERITSLGWEEAKYQGMLGM